MKCWRCGQTISESTDTCQYCGTDQHRTPADTKAGKALRSLYDEYGAEKIFSSSDYIENVLEESIPDSKILRNQIHSAFDVGIGKQFFEQIRTVGSPNQSFDKLISMMMENAGISDKMAVEIIGFFDEMIGWHHHHQMNSIHTNNFINTPDLKDAERISYNKNSDNLHLNINNSISETGEKAVSSRRNLLTIFILIITVILCFFIYYQMNQSNHNEDLRKTLSYSYALSTESAIQSTVAALQSAAAAANQNATNAVRDYKETQAVIEKANEAQEQTRIAQTQEALRSETANAPEIIQRQYSLKVGNIIYFGHYEQDNRTSNGSEPIEWIILDVKGNQALLLSKYGLDVQPYNTTMTDVTWSDCTLRTWLNRTFLNTAFTSSEQNMILTTNVDNSSRQGNREWNTYGGSNTSDKVFLLSYKEAATYFSNDSSRRMTATSFAKARGTQVSSSGYSWWWLRSPGRYQSTAAHVHYDGIIIRCSVSDLDVCIRPAMWVNFY